MPSREYSKSKSFLTQPKSLADALPAQCLELGTSPGRIRRSHVAGSQQGPEWLQKSLSPKTLDFFQDTGFLNPVSEKVTVHCAVLNLKKKKKKERKEAKRKHIQKCRGNSAAELAP